MTKTCQNFQVFIELPCTRPCESNRGQSLCSSFFFHRVPILFADEVGSHVMEKIFHVASQDLYELLFEKCFKNNLLQLSLHPLANYILQHMFSTIPTKEMVGDRYDMK